jgi:hypothetical protein
LGDIVKKSSLPTPIRNRGSKWDTEIEQALNLQVDESLRVDLQGTTNLVSAVIGIRARLKKKQLDGKLMVRQIRDLVYIERKPEMVLVMDGSTVNVYPQ